MQARKQWARVGLTLLVLATGVTLLTTAGWATPTKPGITVQLAPANQSVTRGSTAAWTVTLTSANGLAGPVTLTASGLPAGTTATFSPAVTSLAASGARSTVTATLAVTTSTSTPLGPDTFSVTATSGKVTGSMTAGLTVNPPLSGSLALTATPATVTIAPGATAAYGLVLSRTNLPGDVTFAVSGAPAGTSATVAPSPTSGTAATLQVVTTDQTGEGTFALTVTAAGQDAGGATRSALATVQLAITTTHRQLVVSGDVDGLAPGLLRPLDLTVTNQDKKPVSVTNLAVSLQSVSRTPYAVAHGLACGLTDYAVRQYSGPYPLAVPGLASRSLDQLGIPAGQWPQVMLVDRPVNQDGCKGATLTLGYAGSGQGS
ncbi:MAG: COG1470 family protein [Oryzihumus sp.]